MGKVRAAGLPLRPPLTRGSGKGWAEVTAAPCPRGGARTGLFLGSTGLSETPWLCFAGVCCDGSECAGDKGTSQQGLPPGGWGDDQGPCLLEVLGDSSRSHPPSAVQESHGDFKNATSQGTLGILVCRVWGAARTLEFQSSPDGSSVHPGLRVGVGVQTSPKCPGLGPLLPAVPAHLGWAIYSRAFTEMRTRSQPQ